METVVPNGPFDIGASFSSYEDLQAAIQRYEEENYVQFWVKSSRTIAAAKKKGLTRDVDPALKFAEIEYSCTNGGRKFTSRSTGERPNQKTSKIGCKARITFITSRDGHALQVKAIETTHNHIVSKGCYEQLPRQRKLTGQQLNDTEKILSLGGNKKLIQMNLRSSGKVVLLRDLRNVQTAAATSKESHQSETLQSIAAIAKQAGGTLDILASEEDNQLVGIFFQDEDMRSAFKSYPEIVFVDAIHKTNDRRLPLYFICVEDSNGYTEVAGFFLCVSEDENTVRSLFHRFVVNSGEENMLRTSAVMTDKDFTEKKILAEIFPNANFYLCLFHVLRTFRRQITPQKMSITPDARNSILEKLGINN
ncbi:uncharacterized protein LOC119402518 [Rhipicephalus sanguineus]|uniref:uncharacterized protein LOC119402518 n=1 Tax=Rhipicephalus sanguineus TaxID=34632 RepID=UPI0020C2DCDB|nr:uncharacterized protein LOC119402518 [Rhipicephalus sanguineus]